jgi:hypothetical protein
VQPSAGQAPVPLHCLRRDLQHLSYLFYAQAREVPHFDNLTLAGMLFGKTGESQIQIEQFFRLILDNVPGGAGLVARLEDSAVLRECLEVASRRVSGICGCAEITSCEGCLRSYTNQFAHARLARGLAERISNRHSQPLDFGVCVTNMHTRSDCSLSGGALFFMATIHILNRQILALSTAEMAMGL